MKTRAQAMPEHAPQDLTIDLIEGKESRWSLIDNLLAKEQKTLRDYLDGNLEQG